MLIFPTKQTLLYISEQRKMYRLAQLATLGPSTLIVQYFVQCPPTNDAKRRHSNHTRSRPTTSYVRRG